MPLAIAPALGSPERASLPYPGSAGMTRWKPGPGRAALLPRAAGAVVQVGAGAIEDFVGEVWVGVGNGT
jgi:hypothetical protein